MQSWIKFQEQSFEKHYSKEEISPTIDENILYCFASLLKKTENERIMLCDIGGGSGANSALLKQILENQFEISVQTSIVCDISFIGLKKARLYDFEVIKCSITNLPFRENIFYIGFNVHVLEHIINDRKALQEICRIIKPKGLLYFGTPNKATNMYFPFRLDEYIIGRNPLHIRDGYNANLITKEFHKFNFKRLTLKFHGYWGAFIAHLIEYFFGILTYLPRTVLKYQIKPIQQKIKKIQNKFYKFDKLFGDTNPHGMNFFMFFRKEIPLYKLKEKK